ncbi:MAG: hypothetical protein JF588_07845 [Caulobacterales bacterium]|nr:hypothetical protein [Caulobacterales bacterium]
MTDRPDTLDQYRLPLNRGQMKQAGALAPALKYVPKNPFIWIGAAVVGVAGVLAWRNREKIANAAAPVIADARAKGEALIDQASVKGHELIEEAKAKSEAVVAKAKSVRRGAAPKIPPAEVH